MLSYNPNASKKHPISNNSSGADLLNLLNTTQDAFYRCYNNMYYPHDLVVTNPPTYKIRLSFNSNHPFNKIAINTHPQSTVGPKLSWYWTAFLSLIAWARYK